MRTVPLGFLAVFLLTSTRAVAYPIPPVTLWELLETSDRVVLAEVSEVVEASPPPADLQAAPSTAFPNIPDVKARLLVSETWKGEPEAEILVAFQPGLICPAPPRYEVGRTVLAFLVQTDAGWRTRGLSYGTLYPHAEDVSDFRRLVQEANQLQNDGSLTDTKLLSWLVDAASHPGTRWHGLYQLLPRADRLHSYYDPKRASTMSDSGLSGAQLQKIAAGFVASPPLDRTLPMALEILAGYSDPKLDHAALSAIEALLAREQPPWWIQDAIRAILRRFGDPAPEERLRPLGGPFAEFDADALRRIWRQASQELVIPRVRPAEEREVEVWGVGSNTPS